MQDYFPARQRRNAFHTCFSLGLGLLCILFFTTAFSQETDYFGDLIKSSDGVDENMFGVETEEIPDPQDLVTLQPIRMKAVGTLTAGLIKPELRSAKLVNAEAFENRARIPVGTILQFDIQYERINGITLNRIAVLRSKLYSPNHFSDEDGLKWQKSSHKRWASYANVTKKTSFTYKNIASNMRRYDGFLRINTGDLKPGRYHFLIGTSRKEDGKTVEKDTERFDFTIIDAPLHLVAEIPKSIPTYNPDRNVWAGEYKAFLSDWAISPMKVEIISDVPGFAIRDGKDLYESVVEFQLRPKKKYIGHTESFTIKVTDRLGRTASLTRDVYITDSSDFEIKVDMARNANAGETITGRVIYPSGFVLKKKPRTNVKTGFAWTNSDYTAFRVKVKEEGVDYKKLFAIIATGKMSGMEEEQVLTWKRTYNVKSQDLIYDPEAIRRKKQASDRAWREAFSTVAAVAGAAASAYESSSSENADDFWYDDDSENWDEENNSNYEVVSNEWSDDDGGSNGKSQGSQSNNYQSSGSNSSEISESSVCGVAIEGRLNDWKNIENKTGWWRYKEEPTQVDYYGDNSTDTKSYKTIILLKKGIPDNHGIEQAHELRFVKNNCVLALERNPTSRGFYDEYKFYYNGGKKSEFSNNAQVGKQVTKYWDQKGNLTHHSIGFGDKNNVVCNNHKKTKAPRCS